MGKIEKNNLGLIDDEGEVENSKGVLLNREIKKTKAEKMAEIQKKIQNVIDEEIKIYFEEKDKLEKIIKRKTDAHGKIVIDQECKDTMKKIETDRLKREEERIEKLRIILKEIMGPKDIEMEIEEIMGDIIRELEKRMIARYKLKREESKIPEAIYVDEEEKIKAFLSHEQGINRTKKEITRAKEELNWTENEIKIKGQTIRHREIEGEIIEHLKIKERDEKELSLYIKKLEWNELMLKKAQPREREDILKKIEEYSIVIKALKGNIEIIEGYIKERVERKLLEQKKELELTVAHYEYALKAAEEDFKKFKEREGIF